MKLQGILFDLGDTLLDFGVVDIASLFAAGARQAYDFLQGLHQPLPSYHQFHRRQFRAIRWNYLKSRLTRREFSSQVLLRELARRMGQQITPEQVDELAWLYYEPLSRRASIEPGLRELLQGFRQRGLALGVVSNTFILAQALDRHLTSAGLIDLLPVRVYSCDVRYRKPDRRIFRIALERLGTAPEATLFVGDNLRADIAGANRAGLISVLKDRTGLVKTRFTRPAHRVQALSELPQIVDRYG